jgi:hypothetical protein
MDESLLAKDRKEGGCRQGRGVPAGGDGPRGASLHLATQGDDAMPTEEEILTLKGELETRLELVNSDPEYEGEQATVGDQLLLVLVGLVIPAVLMIGGWLIYA